jgi:hypothetical protein
MMRVKLSKGQIYRTSEITGNIAVAWFTAGAITPLFSEQSTLFDFLIRFGVSLLMFISFFVLSISLSRKVEK